jgi:DNA-binding response OmpR family regulator
MIMGNEVDIKKPKALDELKVQYRITAEEAAKLEPYILSSFQRVAVKGKILLVDDDLLLLQSLEGLLNDSGFQVIPADSVAKGLEVLTNTAVDLILSDIKFKDEELDGFQFFLSVQAQPHLRKIPFVFMSSLRDGVIIRSGVQLGADDYLTKPVEPDLLIAVVEGKLKRYRNFQGN